MVLCTMRTSGGLAQCLHSETTVEWSSVFTGSRCSCSVGAVWTSSPSFGVHFPLSSQARHFGNLTLGNLRRLPVQWDGTITPPPRIRLGRKGCSLYSFIRSSLYSPYLSSHSMTVYSMLGSVFSVMKKTESMLSERLQISKGDCRETP